MSESRSASRFGEHLHVVLDGYRGGQQQQQVDPPGGGPIAGAARL